MRVGQKSNWRNGLFGVYRIERDILITCVEAIVFWNSALSAFSLSKTCLSTPASRSSSSCCLFPTFAMSGHICMIKPIMPYLKIGNCETPECSYHIIRHLENYLRACWTISLLVMYGTVTWIFGHLNLTLRDPGRANFPLTPFVLPPSLQLPAFAV
jgi:hypothetical protein